MDMEYRYTKIDLHEWARGALFSHYMKHMRIVMSLTADIDVTPLVAFSKARGCAKRDGRRCSIQACFVKLCMELRQCRASWRHLL